ncbi:unnamed protein product [Staurois parvus]|uniref:Uncharacterized protein n=1 Tax=Staurois parvus TaxID=386267 RepID=A0ABN9GNC0_9NEOB|nr:unnamed protein product [Staurois parvus]
MDSRAHDTQGRSPSTSLENAAYTGTSVPSTVVFSSVCGVPLELMAPACGMAPGGGVAALRTGLSLGPDRGSAI